ncbi:phage repressor protein CI [Vibrio splendidus]|uniref:phage repressor protein CI n=1 Tax=Vibrio splendidus TaxID=29497 RepID=UPI000C857C8D|nr:phage repressor protein CI [Vibrio splendidus]PMM16827.1 chromosome partitioning protein ParA [Vibrio splendidus]PMN26589.1 chromosome partitioning protein ParA [Vibrio splendidus]
MSDRKQILPLNYMKGSEFTENLKRITKSRTFPDLAELLNVPKATFSTWNLHERTSHELMVRLHLALGVPIEELALSEEERAKLPFHQSATATPQIPAQEADSSSNPQHGTVILKSYNLENGKLLPTGDMPYAKRIFNGWDLNELATIEVETNQTRYLVDQSQNDAVSGEYLIDMNGRMSINHIQRLPNKLAVVFGTSTVEVSEKDIRVIGRVTVSLKQ